MQEGGEFLLSCMQFLPLPSAMSITICEPTALYEQKATKLAGRMLGQRS